MGEAWSRTVHLLVFNGLADWEIGLVAYELNTRVGMPVVTIGFTTESARSGGGLRIVPDVALRSVDPATISLLILPGGAMWQTLDNEPLRSLIRALRGRDVPIAAICGATTFLARMGLLDDVTHTSNSLDYLAEAAPGYIGRDAYVDQPAARDEGIITAGGDASAEFAYEILAELRAYNGVQLEEFAQFWRCRSP